MIGNPNERNYLIGGLKPLTKYRVQVRAMTSAGLSTSPAMVELTTGVSLGKYKIGEQYRLPPMNTLSFQYHQNQTSS